MRRLIDAIIYLTCVTVPVNGTAIGVTDIFADGNRVDGVNRSLLRAAVHGDIDEAKAALARGADVNARDMIGAPVLDVAARHGRPQIVKLLINNGATVDARNSKYGQTPLHGATWAGSGCLRFPACMWAARW